MERLSLVGGKRVLSIIDQYKDFRVYIRRGFAYRGAAEKLDDKTPQPTFANGRYCVQTFEERMKRMCDYYVAFDVDIDHDKCELHINAFSVNDMY